MGYLANQFDIDVTWRNLESFENDILKKGFPEFIDYQLVNYRGFKTDVYGVYVIKTEENSEIHNYGLLKNQNAKWGFSQANVAVIVENIEENILHELLHTLGIDECYDNECKPKDTCHNEKCIMRYANTRGLHVCEHVDRTLRNNLCA